jgi:hypothetical protein
MSAIKALETASFPVAARTVCAACATLALLGSLGVTAPATTAPTQVIVQLTSLHEPLAAFALAAVLWWPQQRNGPGPLLAVHLLGADGTRYSPSWPAPFRSLCGGLTQPQLWSIVLAGLGAPSWRTQASGTCHRPSQDKPYVP